MREREREENKRLEFQLRKDQPEFVKNFYCEFDEDLDGDPAVSVGVRFQPTVGSPFLTMKQSQGRNPYPTCGEFHIDQVSSANNCTWFRRAS